MGRFKVPTQKIEIPQTDDSFSVRGISLSDVSAIMANHGQILAEVFAGRAAHAAEGLSNDDMKALGRALLEQCPEAAAEIIALAADDADHIDDYKKLPFPIQVEAINQIIRLTFHTDEDIKKLLETVIGGAEGISRLVSTLRIPTTTSLQNGSKASEAT